MEERAYKERNLNRQNSKFNVNVPSSETIFGHIISGMRNI